MFQLHRVERALGPGASRLSQIGSCNHYGRRCAPGPPPQGLPRDKTATRNADSGVQPIYVANFALLAIKSNQPHLP